jgi:hypothetical protein
MNKVKVREFKLDTALGYLIQNITGDSTQEILGYFYGISQFVVDDINKSSRARWLDKNIILFYKETPITYRIRITGSGPSSRYSDTPSVGIDVTFPKENSAFDLTNLMDAIVESGLGLSTEEQTMPLFEKPMFKAPRVLRKVRLAQEDAYEQARTKIESDESSGS